MNLLLEEAFGTESREEKDEEVESLFGLLELVLRYCCFQASLPSILRAFDGIKPNSYTRVLGSLRWMVEGFQEVRVAVLENRDFMEWLCNVKCDVDKDSVFKVYVTEFRWKDNLRWQFSRFLRVSKAKIDLLAAIWYKNAVYGNGLSLVNSEEIVEASAAAVRIALKHQPAPCCKLVANMASTRRSRAYLPVNEVFDLLTDEKLPAHRVLTWIAKAGRNAFHHESGPSEEKTTYLQRMIKACKKLLRSSERPSLEHSRAVTELLETCGVFSTACKSDDQMSSLRHLLLQKPHHLMQWARLCVRSPIKFSSSLVTLDYLVSVASALATSVSGNENTPLSSLSGTVYRPLLRLLMKQTVIEAKSARVNVYRYAPDLFRVWWFGKRNSNPSIDVSILDRLCRFGLRVDAAKRFAEEIAARDGGCPPGFLEFKDDVNWSALEGSEETMKCTTGLMEEYIYYRVDDIWMCYSGKELTPALSEGIREELEEFMQRSVCNLLFSKYGRDIETIKDLRSNWKAYTVMVRDFLDGFMTGVGYERGIDDWYEECSSADGWTAIDGCDDFHCYAENGKEFNVAWNQYQNTDGDGDDNDDGQDDDDGDDDDGDDNESSNRDRGEVRLFHVCTLGHARQMFHEEKLNNHGRQTPGDFGMGIYLFTEAGAERYIDRHLSWLKTSRSRGDWKNTRDRTRIRSDSKATRSSESSGVPVLGEESLVVLAF